MRSACVGCSVRLTKAVIRYKSRDLLVWWLALKMLEEGLIRYTFRV